MVDGKLRGTQKAFKTHSDRILTVSVEREADQMEIRLIGQPQWEVLNRNPVPLQCPTQDVSEDHIKVRSAISEIWHTVPAISHTLDFSYCELGESLNILALLGSQLYEKYLGAYEPPVSSKIADLVEVLITKGRSKPPVLIMMSQSDSCVLPLSLFRRRATESEPKTLRSGASEQEILAFARRFIGFSAVVCRLRSQHYLHRAEEAKSAFSKLRPQVKLLPNTHPELGPFLMHERQTFSRLQQGGKLSRVLEMPCPVACAEEIVDFLETQDEPAAEIHHWFCRGELSVPKNSTNGREKARLLVCNNFEVSVDDFRTNGGHYRLSRHGDFPAFHFINACNSASLHSEFLAGWLSFWLQKGWLGIIGTEYRVPPLFAVEFSRAFYSRFIRQKRSAGEAFYRTCEHFLLKHRSPLGLLYSLYVPYDLRLQ